MNSKAVYVAICLLALSSSAHAIMILFMGAVQGVQNGEDYSKYFAEQVQVLAAGDSKVASGFYPGKDVAEFLVEFFNQGDWNLDQAQQVDIVGAPHSEGYKVSNGDTDVDIIATMKAKKIVGLVFTVGNPLGPSDGLGCTGWRCI